MKVFYSLVVASLVLTSCKNNELEPQESSAVTETSAIEPAAPVTNSAESFLPTTPPAQAKPGGGQGLNPEHGMPGHRCDIAVGAPLGGAQPAATPAKQAPAQTIQATPTAPVTPAATATKTAPGMNPAHGQPGHRCDIAVGAPLNSAKPAAGSTTSTTKISSDGTVTGNSNVKVTTTNNNSKPAPAPPAILQTPTSNTTAPGMNPAHGEPGHVCSVAVGAPLPK